MAEQQVKLVRVRVRHPGRHGGRLIQAAPGTHPSRGEKEAYVAGDVIEVSERDGHLLTGPSICEYVEVPSTPADDDE